MTEICKAPGAFAPDPTRSGYIPPYNPPWFSLRENYECSLCTLPPDCHIVNLWYHLRVIDKQHAILNNENYKHTSRVICI